VSRGAALALAVVFAWSSLAKLVTRPDMTALGLPAWFASATAYVEAALALVLLISPANGGIAALALLAGFTAFLVARRNSGVGCGCFGSTKAEPISWRSIGRNVVLLALAAIAAFA
jgi:hypothetical protein